MLTGYVPAGATVFLNAVTNPPPDWNPDVASDVDIDEVPETLIPVSGMIEDSTPENSNARATADRGEQFDQEIHEPIESSDAGLVEEDAEPQSEPGDSHQSADSSETPSPDEQLSLLRTPEAEQEPPSGHSDSIEGLDEEDSEESQPPPSPREAYQDCLDYHLECVSEISPDFASFVERVFDEEIRGAVCVSARDLVSEANDTGRIRQKAYTFDRIRFVLCGVPGGMESARGFFVEAFGGFTRMLAEQLVDDAFQTDHCEILTVFSFGLCGTPWVSLSIVPDEGQDLPIDLLSYEFLTDEERKEIEPGEHADLSQSGLG